MTRRHPAIVTAVGLLLAGAQLSACSDSNSDASFLNDASRSASPSPSSQKPSQPSKNASSSSNRQSSSLYGNSNSSAYQRSSSATSDRPSTLNRYIFSQNTIFFNAPGKKEKAKFDVPKHFRFDNNPQKNGKKILDAAIVYDPADSYINYIIMPDTVFYKLPNMDQVLTDIKASNLQPKGIYSLDRLGAYKAVGVEFTTENGRLSRIFIVEVEGTTWNITINARNAQEADDLQRNLDSMRPA